MNRIQHHLSNPWLWLLVLLATASLTDQAYVARTPGPGNDGGPLATPQPWEWSPAAGPDGSALVSIAAPTYLDPAPTDPAETFTSRSFWIVLGLVVLGSLILMADFPDPN